MKFKPLCIGTLPRVFVNILAIYAEEQEAREDFAKQLSEETEVTAVLASFFGARHTDFGKPTESNLAKIFAAVLNVPKVERERFIKPFDRFLSYLGQQDAWGTEGQSDPRGDRRDLDAYAD
jgi:hypothetical protein